MAIKLGLRPETFEEYIGQERLKERLQIHICGSLANYTKLDHILLLGPPGCGKTTLASIIADAANKEFRSLVMPVDDLSILAEVNEYDGILFLDELHRLSKSQQENLLTVLEDGYGQTRKGMIVPCPDATIIGASTEPDKIIEPLYDRFTIKPPFDPYTDEEMGLIVQQQMMLLGIVIEPELAEKLGRAAGGTPRNVRQFTKMAQDMMLDEIVDVQQVNRILDVCRVNEDGLTENHIRYLNLLGKMGGVAGLKIVSSQLKMPPGAVVSLEDLLIQRGLLSYSGQGRSLTPKAMKQYLLSQ